jgi:hypothetical protein
MHSRRRGVKWEAAEKRHPETSKKTVDIGGRVLTFVLTSPIFITYWFVRSSTSELERVKGIEPPVPEGTAVPKVDWRAQAREIWRGRVFSAAEVQEIDDYEQEGEEG